MLMLEHRTRETARDYAIRVIRENIIRLELEPGAMVSENEIAAHLGLSRTPVREALIELSKVGIVEILPQKGSRIALIDYNLVEEARFMRLVLEKAIVELLCQKGLEEEQVAILSENIQLQAFQVENPVSSRLFQLDDDFHRALFRFADREMTYQLAKNVNVHFDRVRSMSMRGEHMRDAELVQEHRNLLDAILSKDAARATELITAHLTRYKVDARYIFENYHRYVKDGQPAAGLTRV